MVAASRKAKLSQAEIKEERARMERQLAETSEELAEIQARLEERGDYSLGEGDPAIHNWEVNLALHQRLHDKVESLGLALRRIEAGTYGICQRCRSRIDRARLEIVPDAVLCIECARHEGG